MRIGCVSPLLGEGVELIDTPGIGSINEDHARITKEFTAEADAALFLVSVDPPMGEREMTFLQHIKTITDRCLFVQTKRDLGEHTEHRWRSYGKFVKEYRRRIEQVLNRRDYLFHSVSALPAAHGLRIGDKKEFTDSGFAALEAELQHFLVAERGVARIKSWVNRSRAAYSQLETSLRVKQEQLDAKLTNSLVSVAVEEDYIQWNKIRNAVLAELTEKKSKAEATLAQQKSQFASEVNREAQRELLLTSGKQIAENPNKRLQIEREVVRSIQRHRDDLLIIIIDGYVVNAQKTLDEAMGDDVPKALQQFRNNAFDWQASYVSVDLSDLVKSRTVVHETRREGLARFIDFFFGTVKTEITEYNIDKQRFEAMVAKAIDTTFREVRDELRVSAKELEEATRLEMDRIVAAAKHASAQQARIQQQRPNKNATTAGKPPAKKTSASM